MDFVLKISFFLAVFQEIGSFVTMFIWSLSLGVLINVGKKPGRNKLSSRTPGSRWICFVVRGHGVGLLRHPITLIFNCGHSVHLNRLIASLLTALLRVHQHRFLTQVLIGVCQLLKLSCVFQRVLLLDDSQRAVAHLGKPWTGRCCSLLNEIQRLFRIVLVGEAEFVFSYCFCLICLLVIFTFSLRVKGIRSKTYELFWSRHFCSQLGLSLK